MKITFRLLSYLKPHRGRLAWALCCGAVVAACTASYPLMIKPILDDIFLKKDRAMLAFLPPLIMAVALLKGVSGYGESTLLKYIGNRAIHTIREGFYRRLLLLPVGFHAQNSTGHLMSYIVNDIQMMQTALSTVVKDFIRQILTLIALIGVLFYQNTKLTLLAIIVIPPFIIPLARISAALREQASIGQERLGELVTHLQETLSGIRIVKSFGKEHFESDRFMEKGLSYFKVLTRATMISEIAPSLTESCSAIGVALIIWYAGDQVVQDAMTPGLFFSFITASMLMYGPLKILSSANNTFQQALAAAERVFSVWDQKDEFAEDRGKHILSATAGEIAFNRVSFAYDKGETALKDITFTVPAGSTVALVGHSGAGKSTLINLIPRFYDPTNGTILLDRIPLQEITLGSLRKQIGTVNQEVILFDETIAWNIAYGADSPSREAIIEAATIAYADLFIQKMERGYDTVLEKGGGNLSGGERQRLAIARAVLRNPPILILDEATSSLDSESEQFVQQALTRLMKGRTTLVIAHRLSTVLNADCILVMEHGRIIERGRHEELLQNDGPYKRIYQMQFAHNKRLE
jgi:subfamily B ATP-binding cassette protein MsbA